MIEPADHDKGHFGALFAGPLPGWRGRERFVWLLTGFGDGARFLAIWRLWRADPHRCERLHVIAIDDGPVEPACDAAPHAAPIAGTHDLHSELRRAMPPRTPDMHLLSFEGGRVQLLLAFGAVAERLPSLLAHVDRFDVDGRDVESARPRVFKALARLAGPQAVLVVHGAERSLAEDNLRSAGFMVEAITSSDAIVRSDVGDSAEALAGDALPPSARPVVARYAPPFTPRQAPVRLARPHADQPRHALIVGAGIAGCATAWALAEQGWTSTIVDRHPEPAQETSGQHAGLFHGIVTPQDGAHARFNRAAAIALQRLFEAGADGAGSVAGLLRLASAEDDAFDAMARTVSRLGLPGAYVQAIDAAAASTLTGLALDRPAWFYPGGGWARPAALAQWFAREAGSPFIQASVDALRRDDGEWVATDAAGKVIARAGTVVWAAGGTPPSFAPDISSQAGQRTDSPDRSVGDDTASIRSRASPWPITRVRGQTTLLAADTPGLLAPTLPIAGLGYALPEIDGLVMCGATVHDDDEEPSLRDTDQRHNLDQLQRLTGSTLDIDTLPLTGRVGWRAVASDRLPIVGAWPDMESIATMKRAPDRPQQVPRLDGLHVITGFASRGITWSALAARTLASLVTGSPCPLPADLLDAVDAGRFIARDARRPD